MYELFLTALVEASDFNAACSVLGGLCGMPPWETVHRILYFQGPTRPAGLPKQTSIDKPTRKDAVLLWKDLHQSLTRQSYILQLRYDILKDRDMGPSSRPANLDEMPGMLRWADFPDPPHGRPYITQRKMVELWEQRRLPSVMRDNSHEFKAEVVEEMYRFFRDGVEFCLSRQYFLSPMPNYVSMEARHTQVGAAIAGPSEQLPSWNSLTPVDGQQRWFLQVKSHVLQDNKPEEFRVVQDQLLSIRGELEGVFDFKIIDRKVHDTRVALHESGVQVLPQRVMLGKN